MEPLLAALAGAVVGSAVAVASGLVLAGTGVSATFPDAGGTIIGVALAVGVSIVASLLTSAMPTWRAASRPPIRSLSSGG